MKYYQAAQRHVTKAEFFVTSYFTLVLLLMQGKKTQPIL